MVIDIKRTILFLKLGFFISIGLSAVTLDKIFEAHELPVSETIEWTSDDNIPILNLLPDAEKSEQVCNSFFTYKTEITVKRLYCMIADNLNSLQTDDLLFDFLFAAGVQRLQDAPSDEPLTTIEIRQHIKEVNFKGAVFR